MRTRASSTVGRLSELAWLGAALVGTRARQGTAAFVIGEAGIGKTRLVAEAVGRALDAGMVVLRGRCSTTGPPMPFRPLAEALLSLVRISDVDFGHRLGPYRPVLGRLVLDWADENTPNDDTSLVVLAEAILRLTALAGEDRGCLLVIDDLQDADVETLAVLEYLTANTAGQPLLLLATIRSAPSPAAELADAAARRGEATLLTLGRLTAAQVHDVIADCLGASGSAVPAELSQQIFEQSAGNPLMVEELLHNVVDAGDLVPGQDGWQLVSNARPHVSIALAEAIAQRAERLGVQGVRLLSVAAVMGRSFPIAPLQRVLGIADRDLVVLLRSGVAAQLLAPDERSPDWYAFQHPLTAEAMLSWLTPTDRAALSRQAADAVIAEHPDLPGEWRNLAASLRLQAGQHWEAAALHVELARRAVEEGAPGTAVTTLTDAVELLGEQCTDPLHREQYRDVLNALLLALADAGEFDRALLVADELGVLGAGEDVEQQIRSHVRLAWAAQVSGRWAEGAAQVALARALMSPDSGEHLTAIVDAVDAYLTMFGPDPNRIRVSEELGRRAIDAAQRIPLPATICQALYAVGFVVRDRDLAESDQCFRRMLDVAAQHRLTKWRNYALIGMGGNSWLAETDPTGLERAREQAYRTGSITLALNASAVLALDAVLRGEFDRAATAVEECLTQTKRIKLVAIVQYSLMVKAVLAGQQGDRPAMRAAAVQFEDCGGNRSSEVNLLKGLAQVFCALLEEDRAAAEALLTELAENQARQQSIFHLSGTFGLKLLLDVLAGRAGFTEHAAIAAIASAAMRWNRHFVLLAEAVLLGRDGRHAAADVAFASAAVAAQPFPTARHLGLRLVAEAAVEDGWGRPEEWLREAEEHFHRAGVAPMASACRSLLRRAGTPIRQRRAGIERIPDPLRRHGVTSREYEVFELLPGRPGNKELAIRLHISARTVEKHMASLLLKTGMADRTALADYAVELVSGYSLH